jgi:putative metallohydrolase (TIGR04338 family)
MTRPRDSQRSRMYAAEWECFGWPKMEFKNMAELEEYLWEVLSNRHVQNKFETARELVDGTIPLKISNGAGARRAWARKNPELFWVSFPRLSRTKHIVIHEVAHLLTPSGVPAHGREFCRNYLYLVKIMLGADKEKQLKAGMKKHKCKYSKPHSPYKRPLTQEEKDVMLARLLKGRQ